MKRRVAWVMLAFCVVGWPLSALTVAKDEPQVVLALSWVALVYSAIDALWIADAEDD